MLSERLDPMTEFFDAIRSPYTRRHYELRTRQFFAWVYGDRVLGAPQKQGRPLSGSETEEREKDRLAREYARRFVTRAKKEPEWAGATIEAFLMEHKERVERHEIEGSTIGSYSKPLRLFTTMNDVSVNWPKILKKMPKGRHAADDRPPTTDEVKKILRFADPRIKPIVLTMLSSGIRIGSWDYARWGHIQPIMRDGKVVAASLKAYNTKGGRWYTTYVTPEAYATVKEYIDDRQRKGEQIAKDSPVIRDLLDTDRGGSGRPGKPVPLSSRMVKRLIERAIASAQVRPETLPVGQRGHEFKTTHGFRKYFDTVCERQLTLHVEMLEDHDTGLKESYNRPSEEDLLNDYLKAVPDLTITDEWRLALESEERIKEYDESTKNLVASLTTKNQTLEEQVKVLADRLNKAVLSQAEVGQKRGKTDEIMNRLMQDPKFRKAVVEALRRQSKVTKSS
jgi:integrase